MYIFFIMIIICLTILYFTPVVIRLIVLKDKNNDKIVVDIKTFFGLIRYNLEIPMMDLKINKRGTPSLNLDTQINNATKHQTVQEEKSKISLEELKEIYQKMSCFMDVYFPVVEYVHQRMKCNQLSWTTEFGMGDAAATGIVSGVLWTIKGQIILFFRNYIQCKEIVLNIIPKFNKAAFKTVFDCIISIKIGHIIIAWIKFGYTFIVKGGERNG